jgi:60 kDa SS-A/Ro ribonucleoprotein
VANYAKHIASPRNAPQTVKDRADQVQNDSGGFVYQLSDMDQLDRFLILGTEGGGYYASEKKLTVANAAVITRLIAAGCGRKVVDRIAEISDAGRAPKNDPALFALAICLSGSDTATRSYAADMLPKVARTGTHLFTVVDYVNEIRKGWGRSLRRAIANWYNSKKAENLALQVCKYQSRSQEGGQSWSHCDTLRKAHVSPITVAHGEIFRYVTKGWSQDQIAAVQPGEKNPFTYIWAHEQAKKATTSGQIAALIRDHGLVRESIPTQFLNAAEVWDELVQNMPYTALIRNLATMTRIGSISPHAGLLGRPVNGNRVVEGKLRDGESLRKARIHPITILSALKTYSQGRGVRSQHTWTPVQSIVDALNDAFYLAFDQIAPTGKRIMLNVDCSGSMDSPVHGLDHIMSREAAAAMALQFAKREQGLTVFGFGAESSGGPYWGGRTALKPLNISPQMRLDEVCRVVRLSNFGATDCSLPMVYAMKHNLKVDAFVVITDNETYAQAMKPDEALRQYRQRSGVHDARLIVLGTEATPFTIGDPKDKWTLSLAGFDSAVPSIMTDFLRGDL